MNLVLHIRMLPNQPLQRTRRPMFVRRGRGSGGHRAVRKFHMSAGVPPKRGVGFTEMKRV